MGDVLSRCTSVEPISNLIAAGVDGLMAVATLVMIYVYSIKLALIVTAAFVLYPVRQAALSRLFRTRSEASIRTKAEQDSVFIETMLAVQSIDHEGEREGQWLNRYADFVNANVSL